MDAQQKLSQFISSVQKNTETEIERAKQEAEEEAALRSWLIVPLRFPFNQ